MRNIEVHVRNLVLAAAVALTVSACVVVPARGYYAGGGYYTGAVTIEPRHRKWRSTAHPRHPAMCGWAAIGTGSAADTFGWAGTGPRRVRDTVGRPIAGNTAVMAGT